MTVTVTNIIPAKQVEASQTTQYTSTNCKTIIDKFTVTNTTAANVLFSANLVPSGGSATTGNLIIQTRAVAPQETYPCPELVGQVLESGGFISTLAGTVSALTLSAAGRQVT